MPNRLANETSPYLLQHANNPVDWYPWGAEALTRAKAENKPIFLSIGYSACHWCHVMEHESFENPDIARQLNEQYIAIKVDREERPDLDHIYMQAVQMISGRGGWPMSVFLTPEQEPFFGGTYWPPTSRMGMPGFDQVLAAVGEAWQQRREQVVDQSKKIAEQLRQSLSASAAAGGRLGMAALSSAAAQLERVFDHVHGGFGGAPKFPHPIDLRVLLRHWRRDPRDATLDMVRLTLDRMAQGGMYDHLGGGFHRYSVDERWLVPHFEKMLYDNALLAGCYLEAWQQSHEPRYEAVVRETLDFILRDLVTREGAFASTLDADSEGEEGKFYVWSPAETESILGAQRAKTFNYVYDVSPEGNFEGHNILNLPKTVAQAAAILQREPAQLAAELAVCRADLLAVRQRRIWPALDDKVLVFWNALAIESLASAGAALNVPRYLQAAERAAHYLLDSCRRPDGRLLHCARGGQAKFDAYLDDYAALAQALVTLYEADFDERWIDAAVALAESMLEHFNDPRQGGFFYTAADAESLISRHKDCLDSSVPSGNGLAATALLRLSKLTGRRDFATAADATLAAFSRLVAQSPTATGQMLLALDFQLGPTPELVLVGPAEQTAPLLAELAGQFIPNRVLAWRDASEAPRSPHLAAAFEGKNPKASEPTLFVCQDFTCQAPVSGPDALREAWRSLAAPVVGSNRPGT